MYSLYVIRHLLETKRPPVYIYRLRKHLACRLHYIESEGVEENMRIKIFSAVTALIFLTGMTIPIQAQTDDYTEPSFVRLSHISGGTFLQRASDLAYEEGEINMPIATGDRIGTTDGRAEICLGNGNYIRLDENTKLDFLRLPDAENPLTQIQIWSGSIYARISSLENEKDIEIHTPDVSLYILDIGLYRFDARSNPETTVLVFKGLLEAAGKDRSVLVKDAQRLIASEGQLSDSPSMFLAVADDGFDIWNEDRDTQIFRHLAQEYLPEELDDFETELSDYGKWTTMEPYGYVWVPQGMGVGWRPYSNGRWIWMAQCGWTWLPYESWGWAPFHYGRWHWDLGLGWYWIPTTVWGPSWVGWYSGAGYYGWAPLSYYGHPGVIINNAYYARYSDPYPMSSRALTVVHKNQLQSRNLSRVALSETKVRSIGKMNVVRRGPDSRPASSKLSVQRLDRDNKVLLHRGESPVRYRTGESSTNRTARTGSFKTGLSEARKTRPSMSRTLSTRTKRGYPSSSSITSKTISRGSASRSSLGRLYNYISGSSGRRYIKSSSSRKSSGSSSGISSRKTTSRSSISRSPSKSSSRSRSTTTRSSRGSKTRKSSSSGSKVRKK